MDCGEKFPTSVFRFSTSFLLHVFAAVALVGSSLLSFAEGPLPIFNEANPNGEPYTQAGAGVAFGNTIPMGHEWVTRMAAIEVLGYTPPTVPDIPDPDDPRKNWDQGRAKNLDLSGAQAEVVRIKGQSWNDQAYASRYKAVYDVIVGERWVDLAGYNAATSKNCWDAVAQEPAEVQYDHFMRRYDERGGDGGVTAAKNSQQRFITYFVAAAMAPPAIMNVYDGGAGGSIAVNVDRNYFLFGRAAHMFEDSFSPEHTVRKGAIVEQVKSYICAPGSEQHSHSIPAILNYTSGDVVWKPGSGLDPSWKSYKASNMKDNGLLATEATKDLWAAFIRTMGTPMAQREAVALAEATTLVNNWLSFDEQAMRTWYDDETHRDETYVLAANQTGKGRTVEACMADLNVGTTDQMTYVHQLEADQKQCLYNAIPWAGYSDLFDTSMHIWFAWRWRNGGLGLLDAPAGWQIPNLPADGGVRVRIKSADNGQYMSGPYGTHVTEDWVYCKPGATPLDFILVGSKEDGAFRVANDPLMFLSYRTSDGAVKLWSQKGTNDAPASYKIAPVGNGWSIWNTYWKNYMWLYGKYQSPYIDRKGDPSNRNAQWIIEGLR